MKKSVLGAFLCLSALASLAASIGCVSERPTRNGVFNENQYLRKSFLIRPPETGPDGKPIEDPGWMLQGTIMEVSTPNLLGNLGIWPGRFNSTLGDPGRGYLRFRVTGDKLQMVSIMESSAAPASGRTEAIVNAWPITNVDLKYRVNLDGEKTNFYEENLELDWQARQFVKINFAKNDLSDFAPLGADVDGTLKKCVDFGNVSATLLPDSFYVDEAHNYMQWVVQIVLPVRFDDPVCTRSYPVAARRLGRATETVNLMYSLTRAKPTSQITYKPLEIPEKDPIRHKYGAFETIRVARESQKIEDAKSDPTGLKNSGQLAARQLVMRFDPEKDIVYYFEKGFPEKYRAVFAGPKGAAEQTNAILKDAALARDPKRTVFPRVIFKEYDQDLESGQRPRIFGDVRYSFVRYLTDREFATPFGGIAQFFNDPRTGETLKAAVVVSEGGFKELIVQQVDKYLESIGAREEGNPLDDATKPWGGQDEPCTPGQAKPMNPVVVASDHNKSTLFSKMQQYLQKPSGSFGNLSPHDFIVKRDADFLQAYFAWIPYQIYNNPSSNSFVVPEGGGGVFGTPRIWELRKKEVELDELNAKIDRGEDPVEGIEGPQGVEAATRFVLRLRELVRNHVELENTEQVMYGRAMDSAQNLTLPVMMQKNARHCIGSGKDAHWETKREWVDNLITSSVTHTFFHEFGHNLALRHNFAASLDERNFPTEPGPDGKPRPSAFASSVMEYPAGVDRIFGAPTWYPYDRAALAWIYGNPGGAPKVLGPSKSNSISGQVSKTEPYNDPYGFKDDGTENLYLYCSDEHIAYSPLCRQNDAGVTPSEIIANHIDTYDWQYQWRNSRLYRKFFSFSGYGSGTINTIYESKRFISQWGEIGGLRELFRRTGINPPAGVPVSSYYNQLISKFNDEFSRANSLSAAFHQGIVNQSSGERPFATRFDTFYGDTLQQGIILDKVFAVQSWSGLSPVDNINPSVRRGSFTAPYTVLGSAYYQTVAEGSLETMLGGGYDSYPWLRQSTIAAFAFDTHSINFNGRHELKEWIGGQAFYRLQDFVAYFNEIAVRFNFSGRDPVTLKPVECKTGSEGCTYDVRNFSNVDNRVTGPDGRHWVWSYIVDRNMWVAAQEEKNPISHRYFLSFNQRFRIGDESEAYFSRQRVVKYYIDAFLKYR